MTPRRWIILACLAAALCITAVSLSLGSAASPACPHCGSLQGTVTYESGPATCTEDRWTMYLCPDCGEEWRYVVLEKMGHETGAGKVTKQPTCTEEGVETFLCIRNCGYAETEAIPRLAHSLEERHGTAPACTQDGTKDHFACIECGGLFLDSAAAHPAAESDLVLKASGHTWRSHTTPPTCTEAGFDTLTCSVCGEDGGRTGEVLPAGHQMRETARKDASCTEGGRKTSYECTACGVSFLDPDGKVPADDESLEIPPAGHRLQKTAGADPSCTEGGTEEHWTCRVCGLVFADENAASEIAKESTVLPAAGHKFEEISGKDASCETDGSHPYRRCSQCGILFAHGEDTEIAFSHTRIPAPGHKLQHRSEKPAGEDEDGWCEHWVCTVCGKLFGDDKGAEQVLPAHVYIRASGHTIEAVPEVPATCTKEGTKAHFACTGCGAVFLDAQGNTRAEKADLAIAKSEHKDTPKTTAPACTAKGHTDHRCSVCGHTWQDGETSALGHEMRHVPAVPAGEETDGTKEHWVCGRCGLLFLDSAGNIAADEETLRIQAAGHTHAYEDTAVPATCTEDGYTVHTCIKCGDSYQDTVVPKTGHTWTEETTDPSCEEPGSVSKTCSSCGAEETVQGDGPTGHTLTLVPEKPATEDEDGTAAHYVCEYCGKRFEDENGERETEDEALRIPAAGHTYEDTFHDATCTAGGYTVHKCTGCGHTMTDSETSPLGHELVRFPAQAPTLTREGNIEYWKCGRCGLYFTDEDASNETSAESVIRARLDKDPGGSSVETGDKSDPYLSLWIGAIAISGLIAFFFLARRATRKDEKDGN